MKFKISKKEISKKNFFTNDNGGALVYVLVAAVLFGFYSFWATRTGLQSMSEATDQKVRVEAKLAVSEMNAILSDPIKCKLSLGGAGAIKNVVSRFLETSPSIFEADERKFHTVDLPEGEKGFGDSFYKIQSYELFDKGGDDHVLFIRFLNNRGAALSGSAADTFTKRIPIFVEKDENGAMVKCQSINKSENEVWTRGEGTTIHYLVKDDDGIGVNVRDAISDLQVVDNILATDIVKAVDINYVSDARFKKHIREIESPLKKVLSLRGVTFNWIEGGNFDYGFIAQEVQNEIPEIVHSGNGQSLSVDYAKVIPMLVEAIKEQEVELAKLKAEMNDLVNPAP
jgi:hypothetical protein